MKECERIDVMRLTKMRLALQMLESVWPVVSLGVLKPIKQEVDAMGKKVALFIQEEVQAPPKPMHWVNPPPEVESVDTYGELYVKDVLHKKYGDVVKLPVGYPKYLRITGTSKSGMWYQKLIGEIVPFEGIWPEGFKSREPAGYVNIVYFIDAVIVPGQPVCEIHEETLPCASCLENAENAVKRAVRS